MPDRIELDVPVAMDHGNPGHFGLAVDLLQVDPQGVEKPEMIGSHGRTAGIGVAHPGQAEMILELFLNDDVGQPLKKFPVPRNRLLLKLESATW